MAGHSKWANIKYRKERQDKKRSNLFSRLTREIIVAARDDPDPASNATLATAIERAKAANMPKDNIERAIKRATGDLPGAQYEEVTYEGYGPGGVAILVRALTDNRNRTAAAVRHIFESHGGSLGTEGCVAWQFERRGVVQVDALPEGMEKDDLVLLAIEQGAEDFEEDNGSFTFHTQPTEVDAVRQALEEAGVEVARAEPQLVPKATVQTQGKEAIRVLKLVDQLDDQEDVQEVVANFDVPDDVFAQVESP
ncbi:MAG: YebC/PmpR family DNA-binding transcriptional regulator [Candidatus Bipolaricaulaceae bacterium]